MASYFRQVPNFEYVNRTADNKAISDYVEVKNSLRKENFVKIFLKI